MKSHSDIANDYAQQVEDGKIIACKWVRLACRRHIRDLEASRKKSFPYRFDEAKAIKACRFSELLPHVKGKWARRDPLTGESRKIKLEPWQSFVLCSIFGWIAKSSGMRRFTKASLYIPRKNSKSTIACMIGWYMLVADDEPGAEVYSGATSEKQAWEVFGMARQMGVIQTDLTGYYKVTVNARSITVATNNAKFEPIIGKPGDGASPHCAITDEYHEHLTSELLDTMETGMGAREQPLSLIISTAGGNLSGPCREDWKACEKILEGIDGFVDSTHFAMIWTIDAGDDWATEAALAKANPNWNVSVNRNLMLPALEVARRDPRKQSAFKTKHLNCWVAAKDAWFNTRSWDALGDPSIKPEHFAEHDCYLGADFASKHDLVALMFLFCLPAKKFALFGKYYLPETTIELSENQHYRAWVRAGWITKTPGDITDLDFITDDAAAAVKTFKVREMPSDPNRAWGIFPQMIKKGIPVIEYRNTVLTMSEPMKEMDALIRSGRIIHNGDPVLTWAISNVTGKLDHKDNVYPNKESPGQKIDPVIASLFALGRAMTRPDVAKVAHGFAFA